MTVKRSWAETAGLWLLGTLVALATLALAGVTVVVCLALALGGALLAILWRHGWALALGLALAGALLGLALAAQRAALGEEGARALRPGECLPFAEMLGGLYGAYGELPLLSLLAGPRRRLVLVNPATLSWSELELREGGAVACFVAFGVGAALHLPLPPGGGDEGNEQGT